MLMNSPSLAKSLRSLLAMASLLLASTTMHAATGDQLLVAAMPAASVNSANIKSDVILRAVYQAVSENHKQAPEIVCSAMNRSQGEAVHREIVRTAVTALGKDTKMVPEVVASAVRCSTCRNGDGKSDGKSESDLGCECAAQFTRVAIEALGANPSERLVDDIVIYVIRALDGRCGGRIVDAASQAAPQYASSIADAGARASRGGGFDNANDPGDVDGIVFNPTGRPVPAPFVFPPATNGGLVPDTTPVN